MSIGTVVSICGSPYMQHFLESHHEYRNLFAYGSMAASPSSEHEGGRLQRDPTVRYGNIHGMLRLQDERIAEYQREFGTSYVIK